LTRGYKVIVPFFERRYASGQNLEVDASELGLQDLVEDSLVLDAFLPVNVHHFLDQFGLHAGQAGVHHPLDGRIDRRQLHFHEVGERIVDVENDGLDHK
jgi:hypothetical protein